MTDCEKLIDFLHLLAADQVHLALLAETAPVAGMHLDLAAFRAEQARTATELCDDDQPF